MAADVIELTKPKGSSDQPPVVIDSNLASPELIKDKPGANSAATKFENPTLCQMLSQNDDHWLEFYKAETQKGTDKTQLAEFMRGRREQDKTALETLDSRDFRVVGDAVNALSGANPADKALSVIKDAYDNKFDAGKLVGLDVALNLELERRGMAKAWSTSVHAHDDGASVEIHDNRSDYSTTYATKVGKDYH